LGASRRNVDFRPALTQNDAMPFLERLSRSNLVKIVLTLIVYAFYAAVLGASLAPSCVLVLSAFGRLLSTAVLAGALPGLGAIVLFCFCVGGAAFLFFFFGLLVMGSLIRVLSLGVKPGRHEAASLPVFLWIILNGVFTMAWRLILPIVPMTPFSQMFCRVAGCRIGKNVWINSINLIDCYLISIGDNTVIGGDAVLTPHVYENGRMLLQRITIGKNCLIGGHAYISPGVTIGDGSIIGLRAYVRKGRQVPPGSRVTSVAGIPLSRALELEKGTYRKLRQSF
jgi:carbonic anhydrase/acetyltransferase-like protein (isoleucine patch superfamily)